MDNIKGPSGHSPKPEDRLSPDKRMGDQLRLLVATIEGFTKEDFDRLSKLTEEALAKEIDPEILHMVDKITDLTETPSDTTDSSRVSPFRPITPFEKVHNVYKKISSLDNLDQLCEGFEQLENTPSSGLQSAGAVEDRQTIQTFFSLMEIKAVGIQGRYKESFISSEDILHSFEKHHRKVNHFSFILNVNGEDIAFHGGMVGGPGTGGYSRVFFGVDAKGESLAVKVVQTTEFYTKEDLEREGRFMLQMRDSEHIVGALHVGFIDISKDPLLSREGFRSDIPTSVDSLMFIVMKKVDGYELFEKLVKEELSYKRFAQKNGKRVSQLTIQERNEFYPMSQKFQSLIDIAKGLNELHIAGIVHRDIKSENVIILSDGRAKIIDLGLSREVDQRVIVKSGTPCCMSPETINEQEQGAESDIYSFGLLMDELVSGIPRPDGDELTNQIFERSLEDCKYPSKRYEFFMPGRENKDLRDQVTGLINQCLKFEPSERIKIERLIVALENLQQAIIEKGL